jgi:hypothetical protein
VKPGVYRHTITGMVIFLLHCSVYVICVYVSYIINPSDSTNFFCCQVAFCVYEGESIIICNAVAFVFLLAALSFLQASLGMVSFLSQLCRFVVARSVPLSQP